MSRNRSRLGAFLAAFVFAAFGLVEWFAGWYLQNEQGFEGSHDGTRQLVLAAVFGCGAALCVLGGLARQQASRTGTQVAIALAVQVALCSLATYLVDQSQKPGNDTFIVLAALPLLVAVLVAVWPPRNAAG
jgi:hypothetical protein